MLCRKPSLSFSMSSLYECVVCCVLQRTAVVAEVTTAETEATAPEPEPEPEIVADEDAILAAAAAHIQAMDAVRATTTIIATKQQVGEAAQLAPTGPAAPAPWPLLLRRLPARPRTISQLSQLLAARAAGTSAAAAAAAALWQLLREGSSKVCTEPHRLVFALLI
jgi:hypothetical protein